MGSYICLGANSNFDVFYKNYVSALKIPFDIEGRKLTFYRIYAKDGHAPKSLLKPGGYAANGFADQNAMDLWVERQGLKIAEATISFINQEIANIESLTSERDYKGKVNKWKTQIPTIQAIIGSILNMQTIVEFTEETVINNQKIPQAIIPRYNEAFDKYNSMMKSLNVTEAIDQAQELQVMLPNAVTYDPSKPRGDTAVKPSDSTVSSETKIPYLGIGIEAIAAYLALK